MLGVLVMMVLILNTAVNCHSALSVLIPRIKNFCVVTNFPFNISSFSWPTYVYCHSEYAPFDNSKLNDGQKICVGEEGLYFHVTND